jgi:hypothetical protein
MSGLSHVGQIGQRARHRDRGGWRRARSGRTLAVTVLDAVPLWIAVTAGGLAVVNPCGFPLLPAFLSFYVGADEDRLPRAPNHLVASGAPIIGGVDALQRSFVRRLVTPAGRGR